MQNNQLTHNSITKEIHNLLALIYTYLRELNNSNIIFY